ncbi:MAG: hypothetical protein JSS36_05830 [Proteobacteria bacterium]|nr:hypothetical protein [Pseudomonadota bacterium]
MLLPLLLALAAPDRPPVSGGDADVHGCRPSAGYVWSPLRAMCLRLFEAGARLDPVQPQAGATLSAFVVLGVKPDGAAELWLPGTKTPLRLVRTGGQWRGHGWTVRRKGGGLEARHGGRAQYAGKGSGA